MRSARFLQAAEDEMLEAAAFYESQRHGLGRDFLRKVYPSVRDIEEYPEQRPVVGVGSGSAEGNRSAIPYCRALQG